MHPTPDPAGRFVVAIPARNEAARLQACIRALDSQAGQGCDHIVLVLNNCTDDSAVLVERLRPSLRAELTVASRQFSNAQANAGHARSHALALAARIAGARGILATTDADGVVAPDWVACNRAAFGLGAEVVCGRAVIDPVEAALIPRALHDDDAKEVAYGALLDEIHDRVDPDPTDPRPRHTENSGASIAVSVAAYERAGGMPPLPTGEDRGFLRALRAVDARIRHAPEVCVTVSGRLLGRATGGMADTMARRMVRQDALLDADLEPAARCLRRARLRARAKRVWALREQDGAAWNSLLTSLAEDAGVPSATLRRWMQSDYCGQACARIEAESPLLVRVPVARQRLGEQVAAARRILAELSACSTGIASDRAANQAASRYVDGQLHRRAGALVADAAFSGEILRAEAGPDDRIASGSAARR